MCCTYYPHDVALPPLSWTARSFSPTTTTQALFSNPSFPPWTRYPTQTALCPTMLSCRATSDYPTATLTSFPEIASSPRLTVPSAKSATPSVTTTGLCVTSTKKSQTTLSMLA